MQRRPACRPARVCRQAGSLSRPTQEQTHRHGRQDGSPGRVAGDPRASKRTDIQTDRRGFPAEPPFSTHPGIEICRSVILALLYIEWPRCVGDCWRHEASHGRASSHMTHSNIHPLALKGTGRRRWSGTKKHSTLRGVRLTTEGNGPTASRCMEVHRHDSCWERKEIMCFFNRLRRPLQSCSFSCGDHVVNV